MTTIETERLILRRPARQDADDFFDMFTDAETCRCDGGYPPETEKTEKFDRDFEENILGTADSRLFMECKETGHVIGIMHLMETDVPGRMEIGYVVHRDYRRRGYASEAVRAVMAQLAQTHMATEMYATAYLFNEASQAMLLSLGFQKTGAVIRPGHEYAEQAYLKRLSF